MNQTKSNDCFFLLVKPFDFVDKALNLFDH